MISITNSSASGVTIPTAVITGTTVNGQDGAFYVFCPTARDLFAPNGNTNVSEMAQRTATTCFMRGFSEHLRIQTSSPIPWFHRRICFAYKGTTFKISTGGTPIATYSPYRDDAVRGMARYWLNSANNGTAAFVGLMQDVIFKGTYNLDWNDLITAPLDTGRIDVKFDKTFTYKSGNAVGIVREHKLWHGMNKNLVYDEDETGTDETAAYYSVQDKRGMGDYYIVDMIQAGEGAAATDLMRINNTSTLYWHEK
jgi:hypothetical protein